MQVPQSYESPVIAAVPTASLRSHRTAAAPLARESVKHLFVEWCRAARFPDGGVPEPERAHLRVALADLTSADSEIRGFTDAKQVVEFERIGDPGATDAWLVPNPDARFTPYVTRVFPALRQGWESDGALYGAIEPRRITLGAEGLWVLT